MEATASGIDLLSTLEAQTMRRGRQRIQAGQSELDAVLRRTLGEMDEDLAASRVRLSGTAFQLTGEIHALGASLRTTFDSQAAIARSRIAARAAVYSESVDPVVQRREALLGEMGQAQDALFEGTEAAQEKMASIDTRDELEGAPDSIAIGALTGPVRQRDGSHRNEALGDEMAAAVTEAIRAFVPARAVLIQESLASNFNEINRKLASAFSCIPCTVDRGLLGVSSLVQQVNSIGPASVSRLQAQAESAVQQMVEGLSAAVKVNAHAAETRMVDDHAGHREFVVAQAEASEDALAAQGEAAIQGVMDRLGLRRDALALAAQGVRDRLQEAGADPAVEDEGFAAQLQSAASGLVEQVEETLALEVAASDAALDAAGDLAREAAADAREALNERVIGLLTARRRLVDGMTRAMREKFTESEAKLRPMGDGFGNVAESCLPPMEDSFNAARDSMLQAISSAEDRFHQAMHGGGPRSGGGEAGHGETAPNSTPAEEPLMSHLDAPMSTMAEGGYGMSLPDGSEVYFTADELQPTTQEAEPRAMPEPPTCDICEPEETNETTEQTDTSPPTSDPEAPDPADLPEDQLTPSQFIGRTQDIARQPMEHSLMKALVQSASETVPRDLQGKASTVRGAFDAFGMTDINTALDAVRGLSPAGGAALVAEYNRVDPDPGDIYADFDEASDLSIAVNNAFATDWALVSRIWDENSLVRAENALKGARREFAASLRGDDTNAAVHRLRRLVFGGNDTGRIDAVIDGLTQSQIAQLNTAPAVIEELKAEMDAEQAARFTALLAGTEHERIAGQMHDTLAQQRLAYTWDQEHAGEVRDTIRNSLQRSEGGQSVLAGDMERADLYGLELPETLARRRAAGSDAMVQAFADREGVRGAAEDRLSEGVEDYRGQAPTSAHNVLFRYAASDNEVYRGVSRGITAQTRLEFDQGHRHTIAMMLFHGVDSNAAKGAEMYTETVRDDDPPRLSVIQRILPPPGGAAIEGSNYNARARAAAAEQSAEDREAILAQYEAARVAVEGGQPRPDTEEIARSLGAVLSARFEGDEHTQAMVREWAQPSKNHALATIEYAIEEGDIEVARTQLGRMDRREIDQLRQAYADRHGGGIEALDRALGIGRHRFNMLDLVEITPVGIFPDVGSIFTSNLSAAFTGDEANEIEMAMHGVPQNDFERGYIALRHMEQTTDEATPLGIAFAPAEYLQLRREAIRMRRMMGTGDLALDHMGRIKATDPATGQPVIAGNFDPEGNFVPEHGSDVGGFVSTLNMARTYAQNYKDATDRAATFIATAIVLTAAIVTTALTGGAASSFWIPVLVTLGAGVLAMGATAAIKGSRYSRDQVLTDLVTHVVSAATAGLASAATAGIRGAMAGGMAGGKAAIGALATNMRVSEEALGLVARGLIAVDDVPALMALSGSMGRGAVGAGLSSADKLARLASTGANGADEILGMVGRAGGVADDIAGAAARTGGLADDVAGAAARAGGAADDIAGTAARGAGLADDAAAASATLANASDEAISIAARAAGVSDDAMRQIMLEQPHWFINAMIGGMSSAAGGAAGTAASLQTRRSEDYWEKVGLAALRGFIGGFLGGAIGEGVQRGIGGLARGLPEQLQRRFSVATDMLGRTLGGGLGGSASKSAEMLFEIGAEGKKYSSASFAQEVLLAGLQGAVQSAGEGMADHGRRRFSAVDRAEHAWNDAGGVLGERTERMPVPIAANDNSSAAETVPRTPPVAMASADPATIPPADLHRPLSAGQDAVLDADIYQYGKQLHGTGIDPRHMDRRALYHILQMPREWQAFFKKIPFKRYSSDEHVAMVGRLLHSGADPHFVARWHYYDVDLIPRRLAFEHPLAWRAALLQERARIAFGGKPRQIEAHLDLDAAMLAQMGEVPPGSRFVARDPHSEEAARQNYEALWARNRDREVALLVDDSVTPPRYMVMQGINRMVGIDLYPWKLLRHSHPQLQGETHIAAMVRTMASGFDADFGVAAYASYMDQLRGRTGEFESHIDIMIDGVRSETAFGIKMIDGKLRGYLEFSSPGSASRRRIVFDTAEEYHAWQQLTYRGDRAVMTELDTMLGQYHAEPAGSAARTAKRDEITARLREMRVLDQPDGFRRLQRILNDENLPISLRTSLADAVTMSHQDSLRARSELGPDEPLFLVFEHSTSQTDIKALNDAQPISRMPGSAPADGTVTFARDFASGAGMLAAGGVLVPRMVRGRDLARVLDLSNPHVDHIDRLLVGLHWRKFLREQAPILNLLGVTVDQMGSINTLTAIARGDPLTAPISRGNAEGLLQRFIGDALQESTPDGSLVSAIFEATPLASAAPTPGLAGGVPPPITSAPHPFYREGMSPAAPRAADGESVGEVARDQDRRTQDGEREDHDQSGSDQHHARRAYEDELESHPLRSSDPETRLSNFEAMLALVIARSPKRRSLESHVRRLRSWLGEDFARVFDLALLETLDARRQLIDDIAQSLPPEADTNLPEELRSRLDNSGILIELAQFAAQTGGALQKTGKALLERLGAASDGLDDGGAFESDRANLLVGYSDLAARIARTDRERFLLLVKRFPKTDAYSRITDQSDSSAIARAFEDYAKRSIERSQSDALKALLQSEGVAADKFGSSYSRLTDEYGISLHDRLISSIGAAQRDENFGAFSYLGELDVGFMVSIHGRGPAEILSISDTEMVVKPLTGDREPITIDRHPDSNSIAGFSGMRAFATEEALDTTVHLPVVAHLGDAETLSYRQRINGLRNGLHLNDYSEGMPGTISIARGAGGEGIGVNSSLSAAMLRLGPQQRRDIRRLMGLKNGDDGNFIDHAELASLFHLRENLGGEMPRIVQLMVDRPTCPSCMANLGRVAAYLGVEELHVFVVGPEKGPPPPLVIRATI